VAAIFLPSFTISSSRSLRENLSKIDFIGSVLHCAVAVLLPFALTMSGSAWPWHSGSTIATWIVLVLLFITYLIQQKLAIYTTQENRIFPVNALAHRTAGLAALGAACSGVAYAVSLYYLPLFYAFARGASPIEAAIHIVPFIGFFIGSIILASIVLPLVSYYAVFFLLAGILMLIGGALMTTVTSATRDQTILGYQALLAIGLLQCLQCCERVARRSTRAYQRCSFIQHGVVQRNLFGALSGGLRVSQPRTQVASGRAHRVWI
jgi:hypothetical protein